jgi:uncharacterized membrane protein (DUF373 family)
MMETPLLSHGTGRIRHVAARRRGEGKGHRTLGALASVEDGMHYAVSLMLIVVSGLVLLHSAADFFRGHATFPERVTALVNGVLFVIIVMEMLRTVMAHFDDAGLQLKPFLIIGTISAVRHILTVGAKASLGAGAGGGEADFRNGEIELAINAAVVMVLVIGLVLVRRSERGPIGPPAQASAAQTIMESSTAPP